MAFPIFGKHDAAQVGMSQEAYAEQIKDFALEKIGCRPDGSDGFNYCIIARERYFQPHKFFALMREQLVGELESRITRIKIRTREIRKKVDQALCLELIAGVADILTRNINGKLVAVEPGALHCKRVPRQQSGQPRPA